MVKIRIQAFSNYVPGTKSLRVLAIGPSEFGTLITLGHAGRSLALLRAMSPVLVRSITRRSNQQASRPS